MPRHFNTFYLQGLEVFYAESENLKTAAEL